MFDVEISAIYRVELTRRERKAERIVNDGDDVMRGKLYLAGRLPN